jgi:hypothetical protein
MERRKYTFWLTLIAVLICLLNLFGFDSGNSVLYMFSIPVWIIESIWDIHVVNRAFIYILTIAQFALIGWYIDYLRARRKAK